MAIYDNNHGGYRVFIGDLGSRVGKYDLQKELNYYGTIVDVWVARSPPGFAFAVFKYPEDAEKAVRDLHGSTHILEKQGRNTLLPVMSASSSVSPGSPRRHRRNSREHSYETSSNASGSGSRKQHATSPVNYLDKKSSTQRSAARNNRNIDDYEYDNGAVGCITCSCTSKCHHFKRHKVPLSKPLTSSDDTDAEVTWSWHDADDSSWASSASSLCGRRVRAEHARPYDAKRPQRQSLPSRTTHRRSRSRSRDRRRSRSRGRRRRSRSRRRSYSRSVSRSPVRKKSSRSTSRDKNSDRRRTKSDSLRSKSRSKSRDRKRKKREKDSDSAKQNGHKGGGDAESEHKPDGAGDSTGESTAKKHETNVANGDVHSNGDGDVHSNRDAGKRKRRKSSSD